MKSYLVGGAVRDTLLGLAVKDRDWVVVGATPEQMLQQGFQPVGNDFPVFLHPKTKEEYALARTERKTGKGYGGFECISDPHITLEQDLCRRDLTINAMARDDSGKLIDPFNGQQDLEAKNLRHVSSAFSEDPLRVLRVARFAARFNHLGFSIDPQTMELMKKMVEIGELDHLIAERVWKETSRALLEVTPQVYFEVLRECGALKVWFKEIDRLWGVPNPPKWHPEIDSGIHTMMVLEQAGKLSDKLTVRYAALLHDVGKGVTDPDFWPSHKGHEKMGLTLIDDLAKRLKVPNDCTTLAKLVSEFHTHVHRAFELKPSTILTMFNRCDVWRRPERFRQLLCACKADARGRTGFENIPYQQADYIQSAYQAALEIDIQQIIQSGVKGAQIKQHLDAKRIDAIAKVKSHYGQKQVSL